MCSASHSYLGSLCSGIRSKSSKILLKILQELDSFVPCGTGGVTQLSCSAALALF